MARRRPFAPVDYKTSNCHELRRFIHDRTGKNAPVGKKKGTLIKILRDLDSNTSGFRFLDLHPELRNAIYELTLTHNKAEGLKAYPALLRTCKQIHGEGKSILDAGSVAEISVHFKPLTNGPWWSGVQNFPVVAKGVVDFSFNNPFMHVDSAGAQQTRIMLQFRALRRVRTLHLELDIPRVPSWPTTEDPTRRCWVTPDDVLRAFVRHCQGLRSLKITVNHESDGMAPPLHLQPSAQELQDFTLTTLKPLARLSEKVTLDLCGLDEASYDEFWRRVQESSSRSKRIQGS